MLERQNASLKRSLESVKKPFRLEEISHDDRLVRAYTGFPSYEVLLVLLGPVVHHLNYWGTKQHTLNHQKKLSPLNKLWLNLTERDIAFRFGVSTSTVSRYFITWICFLYSHLKEIEWCPSAEQVACTLPHAFKIKYPTTHIIIDASELFMETPTDLVLQSSTWSNYKQHNTSKYFVGVTTNGAISSILPAYIWPRAYSLLSGLELGSSIHAVSLASAALLHFHFSSAHSRRRDLHMLPRECCLYVHFTSAKPYAWGSDGSYTAASGDAPRKGWYP